MCENSHIFLSLGHINFGGKTTKNPPGLTSGLFEIIRDEGNLHSCSVEQFSDPFGRPGSDLLSQVLRHSTIGAEAFNDRVRDGIGFGHLAIATRPAKRITEFSGL